MTPCEKAGIKIGTQLVVKRSDFIFSEGSIVELYRDDGSEDPLFLLIEGWCSYNNADGRKGAYYGIDSLEKIERPRSSASLTKAEKAMITKSPLSSRKLAVKMWGSAIRKSTINDYRKLLRDAKNSVSMKPQINEQGEREVSVKLPQEHFQGVKLTVTK